MVTYNRAEFIEGSIDSVLEQTFTDWDLVIVDDSENDATEKIVKPFAEKDKRIKYFRRPKKGNIASASNFGLQQSDSEYVAILDDDDYWVGAQKLEKQVKFLSEHQDYIGCGGGLLVVDAHGEKGGTILKPEKDEAIRRIALYANPMANSTTMFRRKQAGDYDATMPQFADWDFWLRAGLIGKLYNFPEPFLAYRIWEGSSSFRKQEEIAVSAVRIVKKYSKKYPGAFLGYCYAYGYRAYVMIPRPIRGVLNPIASRVKKTLFSG